MSVLRGPLLLKDIDTPGLGSIDVYRTGGGYETAAAVVGKTPPDECIEIVKASGLRGRGGAGFPTGMKWGFVPKGSPKPKYLVCNADESEPGTFKDRELMEKNPHLLVEGMLLSAYAIGAHVGYIYLRGEFEYIQRILDRAIAEATSARLLGDDVLGTGFAFQLHTHLGAGAYICGEETALLSSLEGYRGQPRLKPPFPAVEGLYACPTVVNNVETLMNVPYILRKGAKWFRQWGTEKSPGTKVFSVSGPVKRPGNYEVEMAVPLRTLIDAHCGGMRDGLKLKAVIPGGSSVPALTPDQIDVPLDYDSLAELKTFFGAASLIVVDERCCMVQLALRSTQFYMHESCGKCTPCREGTRWMVQILEKIERGDGELSDLELLDSINGRILGKVLCALGEFAVYPVSSYIAHWRDEFVAHIQHGRCPYDGRSSIEGILAPSEQHHGPAHVEKPLAVIA
jgi:NADH-quinone oxidoreductase subunit F